MRYVSWLDAQSATVVAAHDPLRNLAFGALDMGAGAIVSDLCWMWHMGAPMRLARDTWPWRLAPLARLAWGGATGSQ